MLDFTGCVSENHIHIVSSAGFAPFLCDPLGMQVLFSVAHDWLRNAFEVIVTCPSFPFSLHADPHAMNRLRELALHAVHNISGVCMLFLLHQLRGNCCITMLLRTHSRARSDARAGTDGPMLRKKWEAQSAWERLFPHEATSQWMQWQMALEDTRAMTAHNNLLACAEASE